MGVPIDVWRARIGSFCSRSHMIVRSSCQTSLQAKLLGSLHFLVILILLIIGNIELNPGPTQYACPYCEFKASTTGLHINHQRSHEMMHNFRFVCPLPTCNFTFDKFVSANAHVSNHGIPRNEVTGGVLSMQCANCDIRVSNNSALCSHLKEVHLKFGVEVVCPLKDCTRTKPFSNRSNFSNHLSLYHPGWKSDFSTTAIVERPLQEHAEDNAMDFEDETGGPEVNLYENMDDVTPESSLCSDNEIDFSHDEIVLDLANFYAFLEGDRLVPSSTVDLIAQRLAFLSEAIHDRIKPELKKQLVSEGISEQAISRITSAVLSDDPLYNSHHKNALGINLVTKHLRKKFYKKQFGYVDLTEINLRKNPHDREAVVHYVNIKETLAQLFKDPTVQREMEESFERRRLPANEEVLSDYTSGSVFRNGNNPEKTVDLLLFMDSFGVVNPLGSAKTNKDYKIHGMYMTLGNFKPHLRAYLKSMRLVMLFRDGLFTSYSLYKRCFKRLMRDLKSLEENGIQFKGENIAFRLQFVQGDNLVQHTIGGFIECFTGHYFCRFCYMTKANFHEDRKKRKPVFRSADERTHESFCQDLALKAETGCKYYRGVYRASPLNQLKYFKVCEPRLAPCIAHDLFIGGVVDVDLAAMIAYFVENDCFSYKKLSRIIKKFGFRGVDRRNKPAQMNESGTKLGGHAVQNWTLLRTLTFLIGDKVNPRNKVWKLYLLLKSICEFVCAPALSHLQIEHLRGLQKKYMLKRRILPNNVKPKHHFFLEYPDLFLKFGALIYHWTLGWEHRHQFFKSVARVCKNFINIGYTLASKFQLYQAYLNSGNLFPVNPVVSRPQTLVAENYEDSLQDFINECNFSENATTVKHLTLSEIKYKTNQWLLLEKAAENNDLFVGCIELLICDDNECKAIVSKYRAQLWPDYGIYKISSDAQRCVVSLNNLVVPTPQPVYDFMDELCFSLKHVLLHMM